MKVYRSRSRQGHVASLACCCGKLTMVVGSEFCIHCEEQVKQIMANPDCITEIEEYTAIGF